MIILIVTLITLYLVDTLKLNANNFNELFKKARTIYVNNNYKNNSCFINHIINFFKDAFDKKILMIKESIKN